MAQPSRNITVESLRALPVRHTPETWEVAVICIPSPVREKGDLQPWFPVCAACVSTEGGVALSAPARPTELGVSCALDAVAAFAREPHVPGAPPLNYLPARIHISSMPKPVQDHLKAGLSALGVQVEVKPHLPTMQEFVNVILEDAAAGADGEIDAPALIKGKGMSVERIRAFAEAAALFWEAAPWEHFDGEAVWAIEPRPSTLALRTCLVMGGGGQEFGIGFFSSAFDVFGIHLRSATGGDPTPKNGTLWSMTYCHQGEAPQRDRELWLRERLPLAAPAAFPLPVGYTQAGRAQRPRGDQLNLMEALLRGFAQIDRADAAKDRLDFHVQTFAGPTTLALKCGGRF